MFEAFFARMRDSFLRGKDTHNIDANTTHFDGHGVQLETNRAFANLKPHASAACPGGPMPPGDIDSDVNG